MEAAEKWDTLAMTDADPPLPAAVAGGKRLEPALYNVDLFGHSTAPRPTGPIAEKFLFPPFTVLDARSGDWQERKRAWLSIGIQSELGRHNDPLNKGDDLRGTMVHITPGTAEALKERFAGATTTSIFDPVVCELVYRWFCPAGGQVVDPFAGGSVRGVVAGQLGLRYWGCELRPEQVAASAAQGRELCAEPFKAPHYHCGDSRTDIQAFAPDADLVFTCPPYGDLEVYSDNPADLSNMEWDAFVTAYRDVIWYSMRRLREDRFAAIVVGDVRDKAGNYRDLIGETVAAFSAAGGKYYNSGILVTPVGTACVRATRQFNGGRKLVATHQHLLMFVKGDSKKAAAACKEVA